MHPSDKEYIVPEGVKTFIYAYPGQKAECYTELEKVRMSALDYALCNPVQLPGKEKTGAHPDLCDIGGAYPEFPKKTYTIDPGDLICLELDTEFGECRPSKLFMEWKGGCLRTNYDTQLTPEMLLNNSTMNGAAMNQPYHYIGENPVSCVTPSKLYIYNTEDGPLTVNITPHS